MAGIDLERLRGVARDVGRAAGLRLVVLHGSAAAPGPREPEDLDLAVLPERTMDPVDVTNRFIRHLGVQAIDVTDLSRADALVLVLVSRDGVPLYEAEPGVFAGFCSLAARRFADTRKFREMERREIEDFGSDRSRTEVDAALVGRKLATIARNLDDLRAVEGLGVDEYREDRFRLKGTERLLQETVEAVVDVNLHLLRAAGAATASEYYENFVQVGRRGVISAELAEALAPAAGLRNRLVHEYDAIDDAIVLEAVGEARRLFPRYVEAVERYLEGEGF